MKPIAVALLIMLVTGTAVYAAGGLTGTWQYANQRGALRLTFADNYSYRVDWNNDGRADINGIYEYWDERVIFRDEFPAGTTDCTSPGVYAAHREGDRLTFSVYSDDCLPRRSALREAFVLDRENRR
ncbi:MAG: hypothetical protein KC897_05020 [Candidatus Omnitrophica bacterium]|nr:hypothetical protein [Candidatus Omnitrophota bacterium]MCB9720330.1 hypothetical protein [Candidatus Omnitrophota bacterium]